MADRRLAIGDGRLSESRYAYLLTYLLYLLTYYTYLLYLLTILTYYTYLPDRKALFELSKVP